MKITVTFTDTGGCAGCSAAHHRLTGPARLELTASGAATGLRWVM